MHVSSATATSPNTLPPFIFLLRINNLPPDKTPLPFAIMAENSLKQTLRQLESLHDSNIQQAPQLLSKAKLDLLKLNALVPDEDTSSQHLLLARRTLELGALLSIRQRDTDAFTRYFQQLQPFYQLPDESWGSQQNKDRNEQSKVTGLYLLLLLSVGDYGGFHTVLEGLEVAYGGKQQLDRDEMIQYPVRLEQALMEGSYDRVWGETKGERVPSEEFGVFSEVRFGLYFGLFVELCTDFAGFRSSSTPSAPKSPPAPNVLTLPSPSLTQRTCFSSTLKVRLCNLPSRAAGWRRTAASTSHSARRSS